jgi:hypothetical protein
MTLVYPHQLDHVFSVSTVLKGHDLQHLDLVQQDLTVLQDLLTLSLVKMAHMLVFLFLIVAPPAQKAHIVFFRIEQSHAQLVSTVLLELVLTMYLVGREHMELHLV